MPFEVTLYFDYWYISEPSRHFTLTVYSDFLDGAISPS
jgi:hypothetical protein